MEQTRSKIALVTGSSRGLGKDMALSLAKHGSDIILTYRSKKAEAEVVAATIRELGRKAAVLYLDMSKFQEQESFIGSLKNILQEEWQTYKFDFLINNAGMGATVPFEKVTESLFDDFVNVHLKGVYFLTQKCLPFLNDNGSIINISTGTTRFCAFGYSVYATMKGGVEVLTKYLAKELGVRGIRVNVVAPGPVETDFNNALIRSNPQAKATLSGLSPLGRVGKADDIGGVVAFLCSTEGGWISGQRIEVSGGINL